MPRIWEKFYSGHHVALKDATGFQQLAYRRALGIGHRISRLPDRGRDARRRSLRLHYRLADCLVLDNIRRSLGLDRVRIAVTGAAPIAPELIRWYLALGIDMREVYGQTENCGVATGMPAERASSSGPVGLAVPVGRGQRSRRRARS